MVTEQAFWCRGSPVYNFGQLRFPFLHLHGVFYN